MSWPTGNLPPGCTQADCDRAAGADEEPEPEYPCEWCGASPDEPCEDDCCMGMALKPCPECLHPPEFISTPAGVIAFCPNCRSGPAMQNSSGYTTTITADSREECEREWNRSAVEARGN